MNRIRHNSLIFLVSLLATCLLGYRFADADQNFHIPFLWKYIDPGLYPNTPFIELRETHYSFFWHLFVPFVKAGLSLELLTFAVFFLTLLLFFHAYHQLLSLFIPDGRTVYMALLTAIVPAFSFTIMPTYENYLVNRFFVMPFLIYAIVFFLRRKLLPAFILLGIAYNLHALSVNFVLFMFFIALLFQWRHRDFDLRQLVLPSLVFLLLASPVLAWRFGQRGLDLSIRPEWFQTIDRGALSHVFHLFSFSPPTIILTVLGLGNTLVFVWLYRKARYELHGNVWIDLAAFFTAIYIVLAAAVFTAEVLPVTAAIQLQLARIGKFVPVLAYPSFLGFLFREYRQGSISRMDYLLVFLVTAVSGWLFPAWLAYLAVKKSSQLKWAISLGATIFVSTLVFYSYQLGVWKPGIYIDPPDTPWKDVQIWAREHTGKGDVFITPLHYWGHYESDFMVLSQRGTVVTLGELLYIAYHPEYFPEWKQRFDLLAPGTIEQFTGHLGKNEELVANAYRRNTSSDFLAAARIYSASYIVVEDDIRLDFDLVYQNEGFKVYHVDRTASPIE